MSHFQDIFDIAKPLFPDDWEWVTFFVKFSDDGGRIKYFVDYGSSSNQRDSKSLDTLSVSQEMRIIRKLITDFRKKINPEPQKKFTHMELTFKQGEDAKAVLGYGAPNWDILPISWPDDISADSYTYKNAWPDGMPDNRRALLKDPRSLIGFEKDE